MPRFGIRLARAVATVGGLGYSPVAPGTCGTLAAVPLAWCCRNLERPAFLAVVIAISVVGIASATVADRSWGLHDSQRIVIDEVAGYLLTVAFVDRGSWLLLAIGFGVFRALDIAKPPPIRQLDRHVGGGLGVMVDDLAAGAIGAALLYAISACL